MLGRVKFTVIAIMTAALACGCGRYEGIPEPAFQSTLEIDWDEPTDADQSEHPDERTLRVIIRDVEPQDLYDENCRVMGPPNGVADPFYPELEIFSAEGHNPEPTRSAFDVPAKAEEVRDGCEAPAMVVEVPYAEMYSAWVSQEGQGILDPADPIYADTFHVHDVGDEPRTLIVIQ